MVKCKVENAKWKVSELRCDCRLPPSDEGGGNALALTEGEIVNI